LSQNPDDFMDGAGVHSASFKGMPPITHAGEVTEPPELVQQRDFDTNEPLFWPDGRQKMMLKVIIQTDQRDPQDPDDDGKRALYLRYKMKDAVQEAIKRAGAKGAPKQGGWLSLTYYADDLAAKRGRNEPPKLYKAEYRPPDPWAGDQDGWGGAQPAGAQQGPPQGQPAYNPPPAGTPQAPPPQYQQQQMPPPQQGGWGAPPPQGAAPPAAPAPTAPPAAAPAPTGDPLAAFLSERNVDMSNIPSREVALNIGRQLGYTGQ
jgi:hypothetical protein